MNGQSARIFVVEDEALIRMEIRDHLTRLGYSLCGTAVNSESVIGKIVETKPDLVLIDVSLAGKTDGIETALRLREHADVPIVFLSANSDDELLQRAAATDPFGFLVRPFAERELHAAIQMALYKHRMDRSLKEANENLEKMIEERTAQLTTNETRFASFAEIGTDWLWETDTNDRFTFFTGDGENLGTGFGKRIGSRRRDGALPDEENLARLTRIDDAVRNREPFYDIEYLGYGNDRHPRWRSVSGEPKYDDAGNFSGYRGTGRDVTELVEARREIESKNQILDAVLKAMPDAISILNPAKNIAIRNPQFYRLFGIDEQAASASPDSTLYMLTEAARRGAYGPGDPETVARARMKYIHRQLAEKGSFFRERLLENGRWVESRTTPIEEGGYVSLHRDTTERKNAELALRESEERLNEALKIAHMGNWSSDIGKGTTFWSATMYEIFGRDPHAVAPTREQYINDIVHRDDRDRVRQALSVGATTGKIDNIDHRFIRSDGSVGWVHMEGRFDRDENGTTVRVQGTIYDITELKRNEIALAELNASLERRIEERTAELADSESRLRALFEQAAVGVVETDTATGRPLQINKKYAEILGYEQDVLLLKSYEELTHPDDFADDIAAIAMLRGGEVREITREKRFIRKDGSIVWVSSTLSPLWASGETPSRHISVVTDITERKQIELAMRAISTGLVALDGAPYFEAVARKLAELVDAEIAFITKLDVSNPTELQTTILIDNDAVLPNIQYKIAGTPCAEVMIGKSTTILKNASLLYPTFAYFKDLGIEAYAGVPLVDNGGRILGLLGVMKRKPLADSSTISQILHIFALAVAATLVRERNRREYQSLFEFAPDALVMCDPQGRIKLMNHQAETIFGWTRDEMIGQKVELLVPHEFHGHHVALRERFLRAPEGHRMAADRPSLMAQHKDGHVFPVEIDLAPVETDDGMLIAAAVRDITPRKALEEQLAQATKMEAIGKLTGGMAHDFNNYLGVIIGNLDLLKGMEGMDPERTQLIDSALNGAERGAELTRSLLAFSRRQPLDPRTTDVNQRIEAIAGLLKRTLGEDIEFSTTLAPDLWSARIDGAQLDSCIVNLANNARDAMPQGGSLTITTRNTHLDEQYARQNREAAAGDYVLIEVSDTGDGMDADTLVRVFEPFFTTKGPGHGTGLGLSMVYGFVKQSGGHIMIYSEPGHGTTVRIYLPRVETKQADAIVVASEKEARSDGRETVLLVEDNEFVRETALAQLNSLGYDVIEATNGESALTILESGKHPVDLLFSDVVMPGLLDGYALATITHERWPDIKVLLTSGFPGDTLESNGHPTRLRRLLGKPYRKAELAQAIRAALDDEPDHVS